MDDATLIRRVQAGEEEAFETLLQRHSPAIRAFTHRFFTDEEDADEAAQECFVRAWDRLQGFDPDRGSFRTWLFRIASSVSLNELRREQRRRRREDEASLERSDPVPDAAAHPTLRTEEVRRALQSLPAAERAALLLVYYHEMTYRETGEVLGVPVGTIKSRVHCGITRLRQDLKPDPKGVSR